MDKPRSSNSFQSPPMRPDRDRQTLPHGASESTSFKPLSKRFSNSFSKSRSSITMSQVRRKSLIYRAPTVTSQKDIRTVCFYLAIHGIIIGFVGWSINILISLLYANQCHLFHPDGTVAVFDFLYCALINTEMIAVCHHEPDLDSNSTDLTESEMNHYVVSFFIIGVITALLPNLYGTLFGLLWKSKVPDLSTLSSRQRAMGQSLMSHRRKFNVNFRKMMAWSLIVVIMAGCLVGEYFVDETHFCRNMTGGRYVYCLVVIFTGLFIFKCIQVITDWEFKPYSKRKRKKKRESKQREDHSRNSSGTMTSTDTPRFDHMLQAVQQTDDELIRSQKRTALFHRDVCVLSLQSADSPFNARPSKLYSVCHDFEMLKQQQVYFFRLNYVENFA